MARDLVVRIIGDSRSFERSLSRSSREARVFQAQVTGLSRGVARAFGFSTAIAGLGGLGFALRSTIRAAVDFESSFAGVRKTVEATEPQFAQLAAGFREMAREIPVSVEELNRLGEAAGQLGIQTDAILGFTRTTADLGVTTNLASEQAATALARLANITRLPQDEFDRLGSAIVELGNRLAATESEIVEFGLRIAGAGANVGLAESQILAIGGAFSSVGVEAERGGTAVSKTLLAMQTAVLGGGKNLQRFAQVSRQSVAEFRQAFERDAGQAFVTFVEGLARIRAEGGNAAAALQDLGLSDQRLIQAFLSIANAGDLLRRSLEIGAEAFEANSALTEEAGKRYETTASQLQKFRNRVNDLQITLGEALAPALLSIVEPIGEWAAETENQERLQRELTRALGDARDVIRGVASVVVPLARGVGNVADAMGGLYDATRLLLTVLVASKVVSFATSITGLGAEALVATGRVNALRFALLRLGAIGVIALAIEVGLQARSGEKDRPFSLEELLTPGKVFEKLFAEQETEVPRVDRDRFTDSHQRQVVQPQLDAHERMRQTAEILEDDADTTERVVSESGKRRQRRLEGILKAFGLKLDRAQLTAGLDDDLAVLREMERVIQRRIRTEGRTSELVSALVDVRKDIASVLERRAEESKERSRRAFEEILGSLNLQLDRAETTRRLDDDLRAIADIERAIRRRIQVEGATVELQQELLGLQQRRAEITREQRERIREARQRAREARQGDQFEALGLTREGGQRIPSAAALRRRLGTLRDQVSGTFLDTEKTRSQLQRIAQVLSGAFGAVGREVRESIQRMIKEIDDALRGSAGPRTKFEKRGVEQLLEGLGLSPEEIKAIRQRFAQIGPGGTAPSRGVGAFGMAIPTGGAGNVIYNINGPINVTGDADAFVREVQKRARRSAPSRRGVRAGTNRGMG